MSPTETERTTMIKKQKKIVLDPILKRNLQKQNRRLAREAGAAAERELRFAALELEDARRRAKDIKQTKASDALFSGLMNCLMAVEKSWGIACPISLTETYSNDIQAYTDFHSITIKYPQSAKMVEEGNVESLRKVIADVKGVAYHEIGHNLKTVPYHHLYKEYLEASPQTDPTYFTHAPWNLLEDQRMETSMVIESPVLGGYFTVMVLRHLLKKSETGHPEPEQYLLISGRKYLPRSIRRGMRKQFVARYGEDLATRADICIHRYKVATTATAMGDEVCVMGRILYEIGAAGGTTRGLETSTHATYSYRRTTDSQRNQETMTSVGQANEMEQPDDDDWDDDDVDGGGGGAASSANEDDNEDVSGGDSDESGSNESGEAGSIPTNDDPIEVGNSPSASPAFLPEGGEAPRPDETSSSSDSFGIGKSMQRVVEELEIKNQADAGVDGVIRDVFTALNNDSGSGLSNAVEVAPQTEEWQTTGEELATALTQMLSIYTTERAPIWVSHHHRGILDPFAYRTRMPGSVDYHRMFDDAGDLSCDIAVTLALDTSSSMDGTSHALGSVAYACKRACETLNVPCTVTTFASDGYMLWDAQQSAEHLSLPTGGGTNPMPIILDLETHRHNKTTHLVMLMTDGEFSGSVAEPIMFAKDGNRHFIGLAYGEYASPENLRAKNFDEAFNIGDLSEIATHLGGFLATHFR